MPNKVTQSTWSTNAYEAFDASSPYGMMYRTGGLLSDRVKSLADKLNAKLADKTIEMDNPVVLAEISALNGHYNSVRQAQSNIMKSVKDTSQAIIRNL
ncbi:type III secretion apparatus needle protein [Yersinia aldovae]|uniref:EscF/YscF/HrpA family type III secretion system needle major subunit n=1 Tax=Yersinia aldovae TaxID=29483 RepID=UPI0005DF5170|nr:EscF/YscF/HrpA family type III secretion system needle major subunit [Yersinia aldovae]CNH96205.1 type III secretion apparatus needle protein [Yersinia aldovae]